MVDGEIAASTWTGGFTVTVFSGADDLACVPEGSSCVYVNGIEL
jgi:hypothetical protein